MKTHISFLPSFNTALIYVLLLSFPLIGFAGRENTYNFEEVLLQLEENGIILPNTQPSNLSEEEKSQINLMRSMATLMGANPEAKAKVEKLIFQFQQPSTSNKNISGLALKELAAEGSDLLRLYFFAVSNWIATPFFLEIIEQSSIAIPNPLQEWNSTLPSYVWDKVHLVPLAQAFNDPRIISFDAIMEEITQLLEQENNTTDNSSLELFRKVEAASCFSGIKLTPTEVHEKFILISQERPRLNNIFKYMFLLGTARTNWSNWKLVSHELNEFYEDSSFTLKEYKRQIGAFLIALLDWKSDEVFGLFDKIHFSSTSYLNLKEEKISLEPLKRHALLYVIGNEIRNHPVPKFRQLAKWTLMNLIVLKE